MTINDSEVLPDITFNTSQSNLGIYDTLNTNIAEQQQYINNAVDTSNISGTASAPTLQEDISFGLLITIMTLVIANSIGLIALVIYFVKVLGASSTSTN